jgi:long-chain acyl-CoA synthetase
VIMLPPLSRRMGDVCVLDTTRTALVFEEQPYPWAYFSKANIDLDELCEPFGGSRRNRVGVVLRNRPGHVAATVATIATGRCLVTLSAHHGPVMLIEDLHEYRPSIVAASSDDWAIEGFASAVESIGALGIELHETGPALRLATACASPSQPFGPATDTDVAVLMMTSGTTGRPKRVPLTYEKLTASLEVSGLSAGPSDELCLRDDTSILWTALVHIGGLYFLLANFLGGTVTALLERFDVARWTSLVAKFKPQIVSLVPTALKMVLDANVDPAVFVGVNGVRSGTAPLAPAIAKAFETKYGLPILTNYGATEFAGAVTRWTLTDHQEFGEAKRGSAGRPTTGTVLRVVDSETGAILPNGTVGILEVHAPQIDPDPGTFTRTTDLASLDDDGFLYIHGRADDAVIRGGFKIVPSVVEEALRTHPLVGDAAMVGMPHERLGAVPVAAVTPRDAAADLAPGDLGSGGPMPTEETLLEYLRERLARYQIPVAIRVVNELPRTPSMKVSRPALRELFANVDLGE